MIVNPGMNTQSGVTMEQVNAVVQAAVPKKTSQLQNDSGFLTRHQDSEGITFENLVTRSYNYPAENISLSVPNIHSFPLALLAIKASDGYSCNLLLITDSMNDTIGIIPNFSSSSNISSCCIFKSYIEQSTDIIKISAIRPSDRGSGAFTVTVYGIR